MPSSESVHEQPLVPPRAVIRPARPGIRVVQAAELAASNALVRAHPGLARQLEHLSDLDLVAVDPATLRVYVSELKTSERDPESSKKKPARGSSQLAQWRRAGIVSGGKLIDVFSDPYAGGALHRARVFCSLNRDSVRYAQRGDRPVAQRLARNAAEVEAGPLLEAVEEAAREIAVWERVPDPTPNSNWVGYLRALRDSDEFRQRVLTLAAGVDQARADAGATSDRFERSVATVDWRTDEDLGLRLVDGRELVLPVSAGRDAGLLRLGATAIVHFALDEDRLTLEQVEPGLSADMGYLRPRGEEHGPEVQAWRLLDPRELHRGGAVRLSPEQDAWLKDRHVKRAG